MPIRKEYFYGPDKSQLGSDTKDLFRRRDVEPE